MPAGTRFTPQPSAISPSHSSTVTARLLTAYLDPAQSLHPREGTAHERRVGGPGDEPGRGVVPLELPQLNFLGDAHTADAVALAWTPETHRRLLEVKQAFDPENVFCHGHALVDRHGRDDGAGDLEPASWDERPVSHGAGRG